MADLRKHIDEQTGIIYLSSQQFAVAGKIEHAFFTKAGGFSEGCNKGLNFRFTSGDDRQTVMKNYSAAAKILGAGVDNIVCTTQKHTDNIAVIDAPVTAFCAANGGEPVDALITNQKNTVLACFSADCQPVLFYDRKNQAVGAVHAGWRGVANEIVRKTIEKMTAVYGTDPSELMAAVGPSICRACFETDDDVPQILKKVYGEMLSDYIYRKGDKWHIDLKNITYVSLVRAGLQPYNIDISNICTKCGDKELYWSHRRDGEQRGVNAAMIKIK